jgi:hypothetical protein
MAGPEGMSLELPVPGNLNLRGPPGSTRDSPGDSRLHPYVSVTQHLT